MQKNMGLTWFLEVVRGVHICNTSQKKDYDKDSQGKFKLPFGL